MTDLKLSKVDTDTLLSDLSLLDSSIALSTRAVVMDEFHKELLVSLRKRLILSKTPPERIESTLGAANAMLKGNWAALLQTPKGQSFKGATGGGYEGGGAWTAARPRRAAQGGKKAQAKEASEADASELRAERLDEFGDEDEDEAFEDLSALFQQASFGCAQGDFLLSFVANKNILAQVKATDEALFKHLKEFSKSSSTLQEAIRTVETTTPTTVSKHVVPSLFEKAVGYVPLVRLTLYEMSKAYGMVVRPEERARLAQLVLTGWAVPYETEDITAAANAFGGQCDIAETEGNPPLADTVKGEQFLAALKASTNPMFREAETRVRQKMVKEAQEVALEDDGTGAAPAGKVNTMERVTRMLKIEWQQLLKEQAEGADFPGPAGGGGGGDNPGQAGRGQGGGGGGKPKKHKQKVGEDGPALHANGASTATAEEKKTVVCYVCKREGHRQRDINPQTKEPYHTEEKIREAYQTDLKTKGNVQNKDHGKGGNKPRGDKIVGKGSGKGKSKGAMARSGGAAAADVSVDMSEWDDVEIAEYLALEAQSKLALARKAKELAERGHGI